MLSKLMILGLLLVMVFSVTIHAYRLDSVSHLYDIDEENELNDPYLIQRLQALLAAAAASKRRYARFDDGDSISDHFLNRRWSMNRRPGLLRLK